MPADPQFLLHLEWRPLDSPPSVKGHRELAEALFQKDLDSLRTLTARTTILSQNELLVRAQSSNSSKFTAEALAAELGSCHERILSPVLMER